MFIQDVPSVSDSKISKESPKHSFLSDSKTSQTSIASSSFNPSPASQSRFVWDEGHWRTVAIYCRMSQECMWVYFFLFALNLTVLIWIFIEWKDHHVGVMILEIIITIGFIIELVFNWAVDGDEYLNDWFNRIDVAVCLFCVIALIVMLIEYSSGKFGVGVTIDNILIASRTLLRAIRLCIFAKKTHTTRVISKGATMNRVDFESNERVDFDSVLGGGKAIRPLNCAEEDDKDVQPNFVL